MEDTFSFGLRGLEYPAIEIHQEVKESARDAAKQIQPDGHLL